MALPAFQRGDFIGDQLQVIEKLGEGGFGIVYLARSLGANEIVAVKTLRAELLREARTRAMFEKEARIWLELGAHPNLVRASWVSEIGGRLYIGMEYVRAGAGRPNDLEGHLAKGPIETEQALLWSIQFCRGMEYAVSRGVRCHRDIKPANILIGADSVVKISDFGIAGLALVPDPPVGAAPALGGQASEDPARTVVGTVFGTPTHMPPEQFVDAASCDERSDIYSFGVVLYQMASGGRLPFRPPPPPPAFAAQAGAYYWHAFRLLHEGATEAPLKSPLSAIVAKSLKKRREERYPTFAALRGDLEALYEEATGGKAPVQQSAGETANSWNARGISLAALNRWAEALGCYDQALALAPAVAALHNNRGNALRNLGQAQDALAAFDRAIALDPLYPAPWGNKALLYASAQRNEDALACVERALVLDPTAGSSWLTKGVLLGWLGRKAEQIEAYDAALRIDPRNFMAWFNKGNVLSSTNHVAALECLNQSLACNPAYAPAWDLKGTLLGELGLPEEAVSCHQEAVRLDPRDGPAFHNLGNAWLAIERPSEAREAYDQATRLNPAMKAAWYNLALATLRLGQNAQALSLFDHYLSLDPSDDGLRQAALRFAADLRAGRTPSIGPLVRGKRIAGEEKAAIDAGVLPQVRDPAAADPAATSTVPTQPATDVEPLPPPRPDTEALSLEAAEHFNASRFAEALGLVEGVLKVAPRDPKALNTRANSLFKLGRKDEACAAMIPAIESMPGDLTFWVNKAYIEKGAGKLPEACRSAIDLIEIAQLMGSNVPAVAHARRLIAEVQPKGIAPSPRSHLGWIGLGFASMVAGRPDPAHDFFDKAVLAAPMNVEVLRWKASALKQQNRADEALALYDRALVAAPDHVETHHDRGVVLAMLREFERAVESFDRALAIDPDHLASLSDKGKYAGELGRPEVALSALRRAIALMPHHPAPWLNKALVEDALKRDEDALHSFERFLDRAKPEMRLQIESSKRRVEQLRARVAGRAGTPPLRVQSPPVPALTESAVGSPPSGPSLPPTAESMAVVKNLLAEDELSSAEIEDLARALDRGDEGPLQGALKRGNETMAAQIAGFKAPAGPVNPGPPDARAPAPPPASVFVPLVLPLATVPQTVAKALFEDCLKRSEMARNQRLFDKALEWADQAIVADSGKFRAWLAKADALFGLRRYALAGAHAKKAAELNPQFGPAWALFASSCDALDAPHEALAAWDKAIEAAGQNVLNWNGRGKCLARMGRLEEALASHEKALAIDPRFSLGKYHKGCLEAELGRRPDAIKSLQQFLALAPPNLALLSQEARKRIQELKA